MAPASISDEQNLCYLSNAPVRGTRQGIILFRVPRIMARESYGYIHYGTSLLKIDNFPRSLKTNDECNSVTIVCATGEINLDVKNGAGISVLKILLWLQFY